VQKTTRKIRKKIMNLTPHNKGSTPAVAAQNQLAWQNAPPRQGQSQPQRHEVNDDAKSGLSLRHSPMAPRRYFPDSDAASSASNNHGVAARKRMQSDGPNYKSPTSVSGVVPNRTSLDDAIRGRLDGMDCLALGSARVSSLQKEGMVQYTCRKMVTDMLRNSGGSPELIMEGFLPHGEDRWMVRIDEPHVSSPATSPAAKTEANEVSEPTGPKNRTASSSNSSSASTKESTSDIKKAKESEVDTDSEDGEQARQRALTHDSGPELERAALAAATSVTCAEVASPPSPSRSIQGKMKSEEEGNESIDANNCIQSAVSLMEQMWGKENSPPISHMSRRRLLDQQDNDVDGNSETDGVVNQNDILDMAAACSVPIDIDEDLFIIEDARHLQAVHDLAAVPLKQGHYDEALEIFDKILRSLQNRSNGKPHYLLGSAMHNIGIINMWAGKYEEALSSLYDAVRVRVDALPEDHPDVAVSLAKTGMILFSLERFEDALSSFEQALQMIHIDNATRAKLLNNIGATCYQMSNFVESLKYFTTALEIQRMWLEGPVRRESSVFDASVTLGNMGKVYLEQADYNMAIYVYEEALLLQTSCFKKDQRIVLTTLGNLAFAKTQKGDKAKALQIYQGIYRSQEAKLGANSREAVETMGLMSVIHIQQCNYDEALTCLTAVLKWQQKTLDTSHPAVQNTMETIEKIEQTLKGEVSVWI
jgi:tetratricopeptide (TPR) repeat protein